MPTMPLPLSSRDACRRIGGQETFDRLLQAFGSITIVETGEAPREFLAGGPAAAVACSGPRCLAKGAFTVEDGKRNDKAIFRRSANSGGFNTIRRLRPSAA